MAVLCSGKCLCHFDINEYFQNNSKIHINFQLKPALHHSISEEKVINQRINHYFPKHDFGISQIRAFTDCRLYLTQLFGWIDIQSSVRGTYGVRLFQTSVLQQNYGSERQINRALEDWDNYFVFISHSSSLTVTYVEDTPRDFRWESDITHRIPQVLKIGVGCDNFFFFLRLVHS